MGKYAGDVQIGRDFELVEPESVGLTGIDAIQ